MPPGVSRKGSLPWDGGGQGRSPLANTDIGDPMRTSAKIKCLSNLWLRGEPSCSGP